MVFVLEGRQSPSNRIYWKVCKALGPTSTSEYESPTSDSCAFDYMPAFCTGGGRVFLCETRRDWGGGDWVGEMVFYSIALDGRQADKLLGPCLSPTKILLHLILRPR